MRLTTILLTFSLLLPASAHAFKAECGDWSYVEQVDAMSDDSIRYAVTESDKAGNALGIRCMNGDLQIAFLSRLGLMTKGKPGDPSKRYVLARIRVDGGEVHDLLLWKVTPKLFRASSNRDAKMIANVLDEVRHGSQVVVRVVESNDYTDHVFAGGAAGGAECIDKTTPCLR